MKPSATILFVFDPNPTLVRLDNEFAEMEAQSPTDPKILSVFLSEKQFEKMRKICGIDSWPFILNSNYEVCGVKTIMTGLGTLILSAPNPEDDRPPWW